MRPALVIGLVLVTIAAATPARAQAPDANELTKRGLALRRARRDAEALEEFRRAYAVDPTPRTLAQIALAEQALGRWVDAETDLRAALRAGGDPWIVSNRRVLDAGLSAIREHLGSLDVEADVAGADLWVNGSRVGPLPLAAPLRVEAGSVIVEVRAEGYAPARRMTSVDPGGSARESVHLVPLVPPAPLGEAHVPPSSREAPSVAPLSPPPGQSPSRVIPVDRPMRATSFAWFGAGVLGVAAGAYFGVRTFQTKADRDSSCPGGACTAEGVHLDQEARTFATRSTAWFVAGAAAAGIGATLFWVSRSHIVPGGVTSLRTGVEAGPDRATATVGGSW
jgi:hypothetical protein